MLRTANLWNGVMRRIKKRFRVISMGVKSSKSTTSSCLRNASGEELHKAAEAVVDAAICCQQLRGGAEVSEKARLMLIEAVYRDPTITRYLFDSPQTKS